MYRYHLIYLDRIKNNIMCAPCLEERENYFNIWRIHPITKSLYNV